MPACLNFLYASSVASYSKYDFDGGREPSKGKFPRERVPYVAVTNHGAYYTVYK